MVGPSQKRVSSPISTGGEGVFFEQHVAAYWLAQLLVRSIPPILTDAGVTEVHFQTEHLGFNTDDVLVVCARAGAATARLVGQVKRSFTISAADDECKKAIGDFWKDYKEADPFNPQHDRFVLVTLRGTNTLLENFVGLLDCARGAADGEEFKRRLSLDGFIAKKSIRQCNELCEIVSSLEGTQVTAKDLWPFLRMLHVLSLDLHTSTRQTEAHIKTLLALKSTDLDPVASAKAVWDALLTFASDAGPGARSLKRVDLPAALVRAYGEVGANEQRVLTALKNHTDLVLGKIHTTIGPTFHLQRPSIVQQVLAAIEAKQVVLITGPAGSGKSVIGKGAMAFLSREFFAFGFRVEEFAVAHIDETLHNSQIPARATELQAILGAQGRKVLVIESVERLLEKPTRDGFSDLMTLAQGDDGLGILMTCRDYSVEQVQASFLQAAGIDHAVIEVPPLDDTELQEIRAAFPSLAVPLANPSLREILRNPYFIDKALRIPWDAGRPLPENERDFRTVFWRQIVRADQYPADGMPRLREAALQELAVRRARALSDYVPATGLNAAAIARLKQDSLVVSPDTNALLVATAHDVLEDWAILQWIEEQHLTDETAFKALSSAIGPHPAVRRSYRKWVAELVDRDAPAADRLFSAAIAQADVPAQFRDDTLVSLLKAPSASDFLTRNEAELLANDRAILKRVIHLLRVACVTSPPWLANVPGHSSILSVPEGAVWATVVRLVHRSIGSFGPEDAPLLLALIEDAVRGVSWCAPDIDGAEHVAGIAHWLLPRFDHYRVGDTRQRILKVIAKIPKADPARFEAILRGQIKEGRRRDPVAEEFRHILLACLDGAPAARDLPDLLISVALDTFLATEEYLRAEPYGRSSIDIDLYFGIKGHLHHDFFPASAFRGPWITLLTHHLRKGLDFLIQVFNHSAEWYAHLRLRDRLEPAWEVELTFANGTTRKQWVNPRLWGLYRGMTVGPYSLQSLLMAVEKWLLHYAKSHPEGLDAVLLEILQQSDSAALAAVVASVATAHPHRSGEALLVLLSVQDYIEIDRSRMSGEHQNSSLTGLFPTFRAEDKIYEEERKESNTLPHRKHDLEAAIANLQLGSLAPRVHTIIDRYIAALPAPDKRKERDLAWQLALHRMDFRQYDLADAPPAADETSVSDDEPPPKNYIVLEPKPPAPEVQQRIDESVKNLGEVNARLGVYVWGLKTYKREAGPADPARWQEMLASAKGIDRTAEHPDNSRNAPGFVAAVCVRDHWDEMLPEEKEWCIDVICSEISRHADQWGTIDRGQRFSMLADRPCAFVVPLLLSKTLTEAQTLRVRHAFIAAVTHPIDEVRWYATWGIDNKFWATNPALALRAVNAIATEAALADRNWNAEEKKRYDERRTPDSISATAAEDVRQRFWIEGEIAADAHVRFDITEIFGAEANAKILAILGQVPNEPVAVAAHRRASEDLVECWNREHDRSPDRRDRNFHTEQAISDLIQPFAMRASDADAEQVLQPILDAVDLHPREVHNVIQGLTSFEDGNPNTPHYWFLWNLFAQQVKRAKWLAHLDREHPHGSEVLSTIFLTAWWKDNVRHWRSLEGYAHNVDALFDALPPVWIVLDSYVRFLYHIGERSMPDAFVRIANALRRGNPADMLRESNTVFMLEVLLRGHVYARPLELKRDPALREAILYMLDVLVESGSSAAFRMRDDFVTPAT
ncbi:AAA family ATPase [Thiorhodococcus minor]|uniref:AAA family ATPase n=1 Tax=Thiorhodococcus minor TaxID=57489 RepID=A0A6M0JS19_9GAMM|nr:AAA family ATPase [Thiorhodococcus minor]NEV60320.1 AAA family ATPase [Thiorhodococcus minor]